jgi:radical SAM protein with 4Fe4S-binding SPASM domain
VLQTIKGGKMKTNGTTIKSVGWGFGRCNMSCRHCYSAATFSTPEHTFRELQCIADRICPEISSVNYGTGEFIFNPNAAELARYISAEYPHVRQALTTNGSSILMMNPDEVGKLFHDIDVSVDYADPETHLKFRRHPKAWDWVNRALELCEALYVDRSIVTCVTSETSDDDIRELLELARKYDASWRANWFRKTGRGKEKLQLTRLRFWQIIKLLIDLKVEFESFSDPLVASILGHPEKNPVKGCVCGQVSCRIQPDLSVTPCVYLKGKQWSGGRIDRKTLAELGNSSEFKSLREREPKFCLDCDYFSICRGGCASRAFLHSGSLDEPDNFCPFIIGNDFVEVNKLIDRITEAREEIMVSPPSDKVHDGYLCTMIIKP